MPAKTPKPLTPKKLTALIGQMWPAVGEGVVISIWDIPKIYAAARTAYGLEPTEAAITESLKASAVKFAVPADADQGCTMTVVRA